MNNNNSNENCNTTNDFFVSSINVAKQVQKQKIKQNKQWPQWLSTISACIGSFCGGLCFGWSSPSIAILTSSESPINITNSEASWITAMLQFGAALGSVVGAVITKYFGPKICILISALPYTASFVLIFLAENAELLCISRILAGIAVGLVYSSTPIYISEIAEKQNRGALMIIFTMTNNFGVIFQTSVAPYVTIKLMSIIMAIFPILLLVTFYFAPESPLYYLRTKRDMAALQSLSLLRRQDDTNILKTELYSMVMNTEQNMKFVDCLKEFLCPRNMRALGIVSMTILCQQMSGAVTANLHLENIYTSLKINFAPHIAVVITLLIINVCGFLTMRLPDVWGRRPTIIVSALGCLLSDAMLGSYFLLSKSSHSSSFVTVLGVVALNTLGTSAVIGLSSIPYVIAGEVFSANVKEIGLCVISVSGSLSGFVTTKLFQIVGDAYGSETVFFGLMVITFMLMVSIYIFLPETKGKSFNEIQEILEKSDFFSQNKLPWESRENINTSEIINGF